MYKNRPYAFTRCTPAVLAVDAPYKQLFHKAGLIELKDPTDLRATTFDIVKNPKNFKFKELEAAQLPRILPDVDAAVINGGYAVNAGFFPTEDSIVLEDKDSPYINIFAVRAGDENREDIKALVEAFQTDKVRDYILKTFKGGFIPVFYQIVHYT